jgi:signal transduction histidine kinase
VRLQLVGVILLGYLLMGGILIAGAQQMFLSQHDYRIVLVMLLFVMLLAAGFSLVWAAPLARRLERVRAGTALLAAGQLDTALVDAGHDEVALLAADFNVMASALKRAAEHERSLERTRRDVMAAVSHDLRTPLTAVRVLLDAVVDGVTADRATELRYLRSAQHEVAHLSQLVDDLFELAQIDAGVLQLTLARASLHDLISDTLASLQPQAAQRGVLLRGEVAGDVDPVLFSPPKLQRVLHNLISNALRHTPVDGTIVLRAQTMGRLVHVEVADTGEGIAPDDLPHVFEQTYRGEKSRTRPAGNGGAGLGLAIARGLVEAHGGTIGVESGVGQGTRFWFTLQRG